MFSVSAPEQKVAPLAVLGSFILGAFVLLIPGVKRII